MGTISGLQTANQILAGSISGATLQTYLGTPANAANFAQAANLRSVARTLSESTTAIPIIAGSTLATGVVVNGSVALSEMIAGGIAIPQFALSSTAMEAIAANKKATAALLADPTSKALLRASSVARSAVFANVAGLSQWLADSTALADIVGSPLAYHVDLLAHRSVYAAALDATPSLTALNSLAPLWTWPSRTAIAASRTGLAYGGGKFVAAAGSTIQYSTDGITWSTVTPGWGGLAGAPVYANGTWLITSDTAANFATSPDGVTWTRRTSNQGISNPVGFGNGLYFYHQQSSSQVYTSPDGLTWTARSLPASLTRGFPAFGNNMFVLVETGASSTSAASSPDGITWTARTMPSSAAWASVAYGNGMFVAVAVGTSTVAASSPDGITWTARTLPASANWTSVTYGNGLFLATNDNSATAATSPDGITWTARTVPTGKFCAYGGGVFVGLHSSSTAGMSSI